MRSFRVATFNVENLNRVGVFFVGRDRDAAYDAEILGAKTNWIAGLIDAGRMDLIGVQEVFSLAVPYSSDYVFLKK